MLELKWEGIMEKRFHFQFKNNKEIKYKILRNKLKERPVNFRRKTIVLSYTIYKTIWTKGEIILLLNKENDYYSIYLTAYFLVVYQFYINIRVGIFILNK